MTLSIDGSSIPQGRKTPHCYHLVTIKSAIRLQLFTASGPEPVFRGDSHFAVDAGFYVLDLFSWRVMFAA
jgi:uncharacterized membrane protein (UPF0182 family)